MTRIQFLIVLTTCLLCSNINGQSFEKERYKGYVRDNKNGNIQYGAIQNTKTGEVTLTDFDGSFSISGTVGDTLQFRCMGYENQKWIIPGIWNTMEDSIILKANTSIYALQEINVIRYYSYAHFKQAFKDLKVEETKADKAAKMIESLNFEDDIKEALLEKRVSVGYFALSTGRPDKITRQREEVRKLEEIAVASQDFNKVVSRSNIKYLTGYQGTCLDSFMVFLNSQYHLDYTMKEYDVLATIMTASQNFTSLKGEEAWFSTVNIE